jgi:hypothetical protein
LGRDIGAAVSERLSDMVNEPHPPTLHWGEDSPPAASKGRVRRTVSALLLALTFGGLVYPMLGCPGLRLPKDPKYIVWGMLYQYLIGGLLVIVLPAWIFALFRPPRSS